jgi:hypothetical protein
MLHCKIKKPENEYFINNFMTRVIIKYFEILLFFVSLKLYLTSSVTQDYIASNNQMIMKNELGRTWQEVVMT